LLVLGLVGYGCGLFVYYAKQIQLLLRELCRGYSPKVRQVFTAAISL